MRRTGNWQAAVAWVGVALTTAAWESVQLDLPSGVRERHWRDALAGRLAGTTEVVIAQGRVDVMTSNAVIEIDWLRKWKEGMGQVLAYSGETGRQPVLALIAYGQGEDRLQPPSRAMLARAEAECARHGVRLMVLFPSRPEDFPHNRTNLPPSSPRSP